MEERISVRIGSMTYRILANENAEYMRAIAKMADELICTLKSQYTGMGDQAASVLALVNLLDQIEKMKESGSQVAGAQDRLQKELEESQANLLRMREQCWEIKKDLLYYRNLCEIYEERISQMAPAGSSRKSAKAKGGDEAKPLDRMQRSFEEIENPHENSPLS